MKWLLRFLLWATLLAVPCFLVSHGYQRALARAAGAVFAAVGQGVEIDDVEVMAPFDLAIFVAMCLASFSAPWAARRRALAIGIPSLVAIEVLTVVAGIAAYMVWPGQARPLETGLRLTGSLMETIPWVGAAGVWLLLLGAWELRFLPAAGKPGAKHRAA
ncbi:MAG TPA: hypothetical protein VGK89_00180 [Candidatus Eisenbacteria bacterium]|jgi:hypothetical protein